MEKHVCTDKKQKQRGRQRGEWIKTDSERPNRTERPTDRQKKKRFGQRGPIFSKTLTRVEVKESERARVERSKTSFGFFTHAKLI